MDNNEQQVDVGTVLSSISQMLHANKDKLNEVDSGPNGGTHGERIAQAFNTAAQAANQSGTNDAGQQLAVAAEAMRQNGQGRAVNYYANGLQHAAQQFSGKQGIAVSDLLPFLTSFLGGVRHGNPAQPGQGTMIDVLGPAVSSMLGGQQSGQNPIQSAISALGSAVTGARGTASARGGQIDPGAASATSVLGGILKSVLPGALGAMASSGGLGSILGGLTGGGSRAQSQPDLGYDTGGFEQPGQQSYPQQSSGGGLGDILGQLTGGGGSSQGAGAGGLGGLLGGLLGGGSQQPQAQSSQGHSGWWPF